MTDTPDNLVEARRQIASMCRKLETALQTLRDKATEGRRFKPQITLAERRIQALQVALCCLDDAIHNCVVAERKQDGDDDER